MSKHEHKDSMRRSTSEELSDQVKLFSSDSIYKALLDKIPELVFILNSRREVVFANIKTIETLELRDLNDIFGKRPGEIFGCLHAEEAETGCGDSIACRYCGAVISIKAGLEGNQNEDECLILTKKNLDAYEMKVASSQFKIDNQAFVIFTLSDISDTKRRELLEKLFFHDIMNTATGISTLSHLLNIKLPDEYSRYKQLAGDFSNKLIDEIKSQRQIVEAERGSLKIDLQDTISCDIVHYTANMAKLYNLHEDQLQIDRNLDKVEFVTDRALLSRVLTNLIKNAYEAEFQGGEITVSCYKTITDSICFTVHNPSVMEESVRERIFKRSFSTKGEGRGLGTYSIKLLTEKYLDGKVHFESKKDEGTTFYIELPLNPLK